MRISSISVINRKNYSDKSRSAKYNNLCNYNISCKGIGGKVTGGCIGAFAGAALAALTLGPVGWVAATATIAASLTGGAAIGSKIGDKVEGKDEDEEKK